MLWSNYQINVKLHFSGGDGGGYTTTRVIERVVHITNQADIDAAKQSIREVRKPYIFHYLNFKKYLIKINLWPFLTQTS